MRTLAPSNFPSWGNCDVSRTVRRVPSILTIDGGKTWVEVCNRGPYKKGGSADSWVSFRKGYRAHSPALRQVALIPEAWDPDGWHAIVARNYID